MEREEQAEFELKLRRRAEGGNMGSEGLEDREYIRASEKDMFKPYAA